MIYTLDRIRFLFSLHRHNCSLCRLVLVLMLFTAITSTSAFLVRLLFSRICSKCPGSASVRAMLTGLLYGCVVVSAIFGQEGRYSASSCSGMRTPFPRCSFSQIVVCSARLQAWEISSCELAGTAGADESFLIIN